ncbi:efflux transporter outer membrane subunit [Ferrimonas aestuarii]|uniref:TolC family protein n=1 Tax=Ferrimonas aestuarii TaxID=2569539 RepID=A0A4U1BE93_9GAMM|nr:TolC family protein [Ferrimonas aestuarii]TKB49163.1 TolC family protein [Ferrimonas aestuarii]
MKAKLGLVALVVTLSGCSLQPNYERPEMPTTVFWPTEPMMAEEGSIAVGDDWRSFINDPKLVQLIELALNHNRDLEVALLNILKAEAQLGIQRAERLPNIDLSGGSSNQRLSENINGGTSTISRQQSLSVGITAFELDFWGRVYNLEQQALYSYLATVEGRKNTQLSLISSVMQAYLNLETDRRLLQLAKETLETQQNSLILTQTSFDNGVASGLDVAQAKTTVATALVDVAQFTSRVQVDINALTLLVGTPIADELLPSANDRTEFAPVSAGLPSSVLLTRPDVMSAEHNLRAAYANIGVARAAYFPNISLTATGGLLSRDLDDLFDGDSKSWVFSPTINLPIFNWGSLDSQFDVAVADQQIAEANYEKTVQTAFQEVADALANQGTLDDQLAAQIMLVEAYKESFDLAQLRFDEGVDNYFKVLDSQRNYYSAQQTLLSTELSYWLNRIALFKALGGGWVETDKSLPELTLPEPSS